MSYLQAPGETRAMTVGRRTARSRRRLLVEAIALLALAVAPAAAAVRCLGDCDDDRTVSVDELLTGVSIALGERALAECSAFGPDPVTVSSLLGAVQHALNGCPPDICAPRAPQTFDDHTQPCLDTPEEVFRLATREQGRAAVKFIITRFRDSRARAMRYMDSAFYDLHDEWYWFRLLNGETVAGDTVAPVPGLRFDAIDEIYQWARQQGALPLDLEFVDARRLGSRRFYRLALEDPRSFGIGTLLHIPARLSPPAPERWLFQLEYSDVLGHAQLSIFFETLEATLPPAIGVQLEWLVRSPQQEGLAATIESQGLRYHDRIARPADLVEPGEIEVYSDGASAGRLAFVSLADGGLDRTAADDLVVLDGVPDTLPPVAGVLTAVPQVPLAHISLLARSRGIPDAYVGGLLADPLLRQLADQHALVAVRTRQPDTFNLARISDAQYATWLDLGRQAPIAVAQIDTTAAPYVIQLEEWSPSNGDDLRPLIGGKAVGELFLRAADNVTSPDRPLAITIRAYVEHIAPLRPAITAALADADFRAAAPMRYLVLEGSKSYDDRYRSAPDAQLKVDFLARHPAGNPVGDLVRNGGLKKVVRDRPMEPSTYAAIRSVIEPQYSDFHVSQGIRFRSSSTIEDIEGFSGAGLYESSTGFLDAAAQEDEDDHKQTVEWAIKKTWASYWNAEAFAERQLAAIDHLSGNMGILVHARADDPKELANGVLTFTRFPAADAQEAVLDVNVQIGATSVTNPKPGSGEAEVDRVRRVGVSGSLSIERLRPSSLVGVGEVVFDDAQLLSLFAQAEAVVDIWLAQKNSTLPAAQAWGSVILDFETRWMAAGWPALKPEIPPHPARLLLKQARSLDPGLRGLSAGVLALPIPRDILARSRRIARHTCRTAAFEAAVVQTFTNSLLAPDVGFSVAPFTSQISIRFLVDVPVLGRSAGDQVYAEHPTFRESQPLDPGGGGWGVRLLIDPATSPVTEVELAQSGDYRISAGPASITGDDGECAVEILHTTASDYLEQILDGRTPMSAPSLRYSPGANG